MQEQVEELHGRVALDIAPGQGTRPEICVPQGADDDLYPHYQWS